MVIVETVRPRDYNDARRVGHHFLKGILVVMDLTAMADDEARQLVDFAAGLICARGGDMQRLKPKVFMLVPSAPARPGAMAGVVKTVRPRDYNEVLYVGHYFREGIPVVMDLSAMPEDEGRQLVDFADGLVCARGGDIERLGPEVFMLVPAGRAEPGAAAGEEAEPA